MMELFEKQIINYVGNQRKPNSFVAKMLAEHRIRSDDFMTQMQYEDIHFEPFGNQRLYQNGLRSVLLREHMLFENNWITLQDEEQMLESAIPPDLMQENG